MFDCHPPLLPVSMDMSRASAVSAEAAAFPPEREQSFGGGGNLLICICPELGVAPLVNPGTNLEDELPTPRPAQAEVDVDLDRVFQDVATLPELATPLCDPEGGGLVVTAAGYPVPAIPSASVVMTPAGLADIDHLTTRSSTGSLDGSSAILSLPVVSTPEGGQSSRAAPMDIGHQSSSLSFRGEPAGRTLPPVSLTPRPTGVSPHVGDSDANGGAWVSQTCLERAPLMFTRTVRTRVHRRASSMADKGVNSG